jgi:hypothetical protein
LVSGTVIVGTPAGAVCDTPDMPERSRKRPTDFNQRVYEIVQESTGKRAKESEPRKDPAAVSLGRRGGLKGGPARAAALSAKARTQIAKAGATARWGKKR